MKKVIAILAITLAAIIPISGKAELDEGPYVGVFGAATWVNNHSDHDFDTGYFIAGSFGLRCCMCDTWVRAEGEVGYHRNCLEHKYTIPVMSENEVTSEDHTKSGYLGTVSAMGNLFVEFETCWCLTPYVGGGIGWAYTKRESNDDKTENGFAYQIIVGSSYPLQECIDLYVEYRYFKPDFKKVHNQDVGAGLRFFY